MTSGLSAPRAPGVDVGRAPCGAPADSAVREVEVGRFRPDLDDWEVDVFAWHAHPCDDGGGKGVPSPSSPVPTRPRRRSPPRRRPRTPRAGCVPNAGTCTPGGVWLPLRIFSYHAETIGDGHVGTATREVDKPDDGSYALS